MNYDQLWLDPATFMQVQDSESPSASDVLKGVIDSDAAGLLHDGCDALGPYVGTGVGAIYTTGGTAVTGNVGTGAVIGGIVGDAAADGWSSVCDLPSNLHDATVGHDDVQFSADAFAAFANAHVDSDPAAFTPTDFSAPTLADFTTAFGGPEFDGTAEGFYTRGDLSAYPVIEPSFIDYSGASGAFDADGGFDAGSSGGGDFSSSVSD